MFDRPAINANPSQTGFSLAISARDIVTVSLYVIFYFYFKGGYYFLHNRFQELGFLFSIGLSVYAALMAALNVRSSDLAWSKWVLTTMAFLGYAMVLPAYLWGHYNQVSMIPSILASREFLAAIIGPTLWFLYRNGYAIEKVEEIILITSGLLIISYIFHYFRLDLQAAFNSTDAHTKGMVMHDEWRGYRLKTPGMAMVISSVSAPYLAAKAKSAAARWYWILIAALCVYSWYLIKGRSAIAMLIAGVILYHVWFARKERLGLLFFSLPVVLPAMAYITVEYFVAMKNVDAGVRYRAYMTAFDVIKEYPMFGYGMQSAATITEQDVFGSKFYSADIGFVGIGFKYGLVGLALYYVFTIGALVKAVTTNHLLVRKTGRCNILLIAIIVKIVGDLFKFVLSIDYMYIQGVTVIAVVIAMSAIYRHKYAATNELSKPQTSLPA